MGPEAEARWKTNRAAQDAIKAAIGEQRYNAYVRRWLGRGFVAECEVHCKWAGVEPGVSPVVRREAILKRLRSELDLTPRTGLFEVSEAVRESASPHRGYDELVQLAANPNPIRGEDAGRVFATDRELYEEPVLSAMEGPPSAPVVGGPAPPTVEGGDPPPSIEHRVRLGERPERELAALDPIALQLLERATGKKLRWRLGDPDSPHTERRGPGQGASRGMHDDRRFERGCSIDDR